MSPLGLVPPGGINFSLSMGGSENFWQKRPFCPRSAMRAFAYGAWQGGDTKLASGSSGQQWAGEGAGRKKWQSTLLRVPFASVPSHADISHVVSCNRYQSPKIRGKKFRWISSLAFLPFSMDAMKSTAYWLLLTDEVVRFLPTVSTITAVQLEELLHSEVYLRFGPPLGIVTDRGSVFTSQYWEEVSFLMQTKRRLSTAFHPQTDGQTERNNQTLEQYLRCFIDVNQRSWPTLLQFAKFAANNAVNASTTYAPHELLMGYVPDFNLIAEDGARSEGCRRRKIDVLRKDAQQRMLSAQQSQKRYYDKHHKPIEFARGDLVLLSTKNLQLRVPNKKLAPKFIGPFRVLERVGKVAYRLGSIPPRLAHTVQPVAQRFFRPGSLENAKRADEFRRQLFVWHLELQVLKVSASKLNWLVVFVVVLLLTLLRAEHSLLSILAERVNLSQPNLGRWHPLRASAVLGDQIEIGYIAHQKLMGSVGG